MKKFFNRMSDTTVYRYATGFTIAVLTALKSTLMFSRTQIHYSEGNSTRLMFTVL